jgi:sigma-B regulation protein RsbU (phosphoserine phosphatase)
MAITHALAHAQPGAQTPPPQLLRHLNDALTRAYTRNGTFVTAFYAVLDPDTRTLTYATAGHNPPRLVRGDGVISLDENAALPLGIVDDLPYGQATIALRPGDLLLLYTDGITEAMAPVNSAGERELFGQDRLDQLLLTCRTATPEQTLACINAEVATFTHDAPPTDDRTMIAIRCR